MLSARSISLGPGDTEYRFKNISWMLVLKVFLQIVNQLALRVAGPVRVEAAEADLASQEVSVAASGHKEQGRVAANCVQKSAMAGKPMMAVL